MPGYYDPVLVSLSFAIAVLASWVALDLSGRVHEQQKSIRRAAWLVAGSVSMGVGIWAMHFVGMQAYRMAMPVLYDWPTVAASVVAAMVASGVAFLTITRRRLSWTNTTLSGMVMGSGIACMHYMGMAAMRMPAGLEYSWPLVGCSVLVAVVISMTALRLTFGMRDTKPGWSWKRVGCALLMGLAIPTMHYLGMAAARWTHRPGRFGPAELRHAVALSQLGSVSIIVATVLGLTLALVFASVDRQVASFESALHGSQTSYEQLMSHHERLQGAFRAGGVGIWECDPATQNFYVDASLRDLYEIEHDGLPIPRPVWRSRVHPEDAAALDARWAMSQANGDTYENEYRLVRSDGIRWVRSVGTLLRSETGAVIRVLGMTWDITAERRREQEIADGAERFRMTLESIGDAVISIDERQRVIFLNRAASHLTGWSTGEANGKELSDIFVVRDELSGELWRYPVRGCAERGGAMLVQDGVLVSRAETRHDIRCHIALINSAGAAVLTFQDVTASRKMEKALQYAATHDGLTGLLNRTAFESQLRAVWTATCGSARTHCLCMVDLDRFKIINDTSGHLAGDALLREIARVLQDALQPCDVVARMGGDEFLVLLEDCSREDGEQRVNRLLKSIATLRFPWKGRLYDVTASSGLVVLDGSSQSPEVLVSQADVATFTAKRNGRNQLSVYTAEGSGAAGNHHEMEIVAGLRRSLEQNRFELYAQPIVPIAKPELGSHFELLIRMRDEKGELLSPALFVPAAERYGLMGMVDRWVIRAALETYQTRCASGSRISFSINLSAESLNDVSLWDFVAEQLRRTRVPPDRITFEVTETGLIENFDHARAFMERARSVGCRIALDDFGTGLSSLSYLKQFALDVIKIDGGFIKTLRDQPLDQAIIRSVAEIAGSMGATTVAECVEEAGMLRVLEGLGVDYAQGWATGKPRPLQEALAQALAKEKGAIPVAFYAAVTPAAFVGARMIDSLATPSSS